MPATAHAISHHDRLGRCNFMSPHWAAPTNSVAIPAATGTMRMKVQPAAPGHDTPQATVHDPEELLHILWLAG
jgi:hypothetical protein